MTQLLLESSNSALLGIGLLGLMLILVGLAICVFSVIAWIVRIQIIARYRKYNKIDNSIDMTGEEMAKYFLKTCGINDVQVKQCSFFRAILWGNGYSSYKKTVFLRRNIIQKKSITAISMACQKVALAIQHKENNKKFLFVSKVKPIMWIAPYAFLPIFLVGLICDVTISSTLGIGTIISTIIAVLYFLVSFFLMLYTIPVEKAANARAIELMKEHKILADNEIAGVQVMFDTYIKAYIVDFILGILYIIWYILKIIMKALSVKRS